MRDTARKRSGVQDPPTAEDAYGTIRSGSSRVRRHRGMMRDAARKRLSARSLSAASALRMPIPGRPLSLPTGRALPAGSSRRALPKGRLPTLSADAVGTTPSRNPVWGCCGHQDFVQTLSADARVPGRLGPLARGTPPSLQRRGSACWVAFASRFRRRVGGV